MPAKMVLLGFPNERIRDARDPIHWGYTCDPTPSSKALIEPRLGHEENYWLCIRNDRDEDIYFHRGQGFEDILMVRALIEHFILTGEVPQDNHRR